MRTWIRGLVAAAVMSSSLVAALPVLAAADAFLTVDGIKGESLDDKHKGDIEIASWSWGTITAGKAGKLSFTKRVDKASPGLINASLSGNHIKKATLVLRKSGGERAAQNYVRITLEDVVVSTVNLSGAGSDMPMEEVSFLFSKVKFEYIPQKADGSADAAISAAWDAANAKN